MAWFLQMSIAASVRLGTPPYTARVPCDIPCVRGTVPTGLIRTIQLPDLNGTIVLSMEGSKYYPQLILTPKKERYARRSFIGTTSLESDVPMPYYNWPWTQFLEMPPTTGRIWTENYIQTTPAPFHTTEPSALFLARNCNSRNNRETVVRTLQSYGVPIVSPSRCLQNTKVFAASDLADKNGMMRRYRVYLAFENQNTDDYVTEKLWGAYASGTIPVYFGALNIGSLIPAGSAILINSFESLKAAADEIVAAITIPSVNAQYHRWRTLPLPAPFVKMWNFTHVHSECRTCRFVYEMLANFDDQKNPGK